MLTNCYTITHDLTEEQDYSINSSKMLTKHSKERQKVRNSKSSKRQTNENHKIHQEKVNVRVIDKFQLYYLLSHAFFPYNHPIPINPPPIPYL